MSDYIVSARKYRPTRFSDVVGQSSITDTLSNAIKQGNLAHSFLFCGPRGVGKTTCARIFAKEINQFSSDSEIDNFSFNIFELDAASNNSVEDIRNLTDQVRVPPQVGNYKVYIIDEAHMLSQSAFNAFLKTLEEPPSHAKFILATTEKHKIIPTILSRCQIFDFKNISIQDIVQHLKFISESESIASELEALHVIAEKSSGSLRDALSLFDRLVDSSNLTLEYGHVSETLNILDHDYYLKITDNLISHNFSSVLLILDKIISKGFQVDQLLSGLSKHFRNLLVCKNAETHILFMKSDQIKEKYVKQSIQCDVNFLIESLNICNDCDVNFKNTANQRLLIELTLLKICSLSNADVKKNNSKHIIDSFEKLSVKDKDLETIETLVPSNDSELVQDLQYETDIQQSNTENISNNLNNDTKTTIDSEKDQDNLMSKRTFSITDILDDELETSEHDIKKLNPVSQDKLIEKWISYAKAVKDEGKTNLYVSLVAFDPQLNKDNVIDFKVVNETQKKIIDEDMISILSYLRKELENDLITINISIVESKGSDVPYTPEEKFNEMLKKNNSLRILQQKLELDPDY